MVTKIKEEKHNVFGEIVMNTNKLILILSLFIRNIFFMLNLPIKRILQVYTESEFQFE